MHASISRSKPETNPDIRDLNNLLSHQIEMIDHAIGSVGEYGEVHLIIEKGRLRFLVTKKSFDVLKVPSEGVVHDLG
jgi:hypothetical protein